MKREAQLPLEIYLKESIAPFEQSRDVLERVCNALNSDSQPELKDRLRALVKSWLDSGPNLNKMLQDVNLCVMVNGNPQIISFSSLPQNEREALSLGMRAIWSPTSGGQARLFLLPNFPELEKLLGRPVLQNGPHGRETLIPQAEALMLFYLLTVTPSCEKIAGPCPRCDRYYIKKRASQKVYCSRRCGNAATAVARTRERVASERKDKLARAKAAMKRWESAATRKDWKHWIAQKTGIDPRFLTRAVTKGDLVPPKRGK